MKKNNLTEGSIVKSILALAVPIVFANILQTAYQLIDTFWVGRLGSAAIAAVTLSFPILFFMVSLGIGISIAGSVLIAQYKGKGDQYIIDKIAGQAVFLMIILSTILSITGYFLSAPLMRLMGAKPEVLPGAIAYLKVSFLGFTFVYGFLAFQAMLRGVGIVKTPMFIVLGTVILNLILDPLFIFGYGIIPAQGVAGAAVATVFTQGLAAIAGLTMLCSKRFEINLRLKNLRPDLKEIKRMIRLGIPSSAEQGSRGLGLAILAILVATFGTEVIASYGIGVRVLSFIIIPAVGISMATSTLVGQNMGAGKIKRAEKIAHISIGLSFISLTIAGFILFVSAESISRFFIPGNEGVIRSSALFIKIMALTFGFMGIQEIINGVLRGSGKTFDAMVLAIITLWILRFPLAYLLSKHTALAEIGIWWAFPLSNVLAASVSVIWLLKSNWKSKRLTEEDILRDEISEETMVEDAMQ